MNPTGPPEGDPSQGTRYPYKTPAQVAAERVELVTFRIEFETWQVDGRPISAWKRRQIDRMTDDEWQRVFDLLTLDLDLAHQQTEQLRDELEQKQRQVIRLRAQLNKDDTQP